MRHHRKQFVKQPKTKQKIKKNMKNDTFCSGIRSLSFHIYY